MMLRIGMGSFCLRLCWITLLKNDYIAIAKESAKTSVELWPKMKKDLKSRRIPNTIHKPLINYVGKYCNRIGNWCIEIFEGGLKMCFQGNRGETYQLVDCHYDSFSWLLTRNEDVHRGRFPII